MNIGIMTGLRAAIVVGIFATWLMALEQAQAQSEGPPASSSRTMPVPTITIYPGETIKEGVLVERDFSAGLVANLPVIEATHLLVGKVARRTLLPGQLVPRNAVEEARLVERGKPIQVVFSEAGMTIVTVASPLQSGGVGEMVRARNLDSGVTIVGTVQPDGTLRVGE
jgi:flagellar basal body P-ring formation protein FlgA